jgi:hypothetical protein
LRSCFAGATLAEKMSRGTESLIFAIKGAP